MYALVETTANTLVCGWPPLSPLLAEIFMAHTEQKLNNYFKLIRAVMDLRLGP